MGGEADLVEVEGVMSVMHRVYGQFEESGPAASVKSNCLRVYNIRRWIGRSIRIEF